MCHIYCTEHVTFIAEDAEEQATALEKAGPFSKKGVFGRKPQKPNRTFKGAWDPIAVLAGLEDKYQLTYTTDYLWLNGENTLKPVSVTFSA